MAAIVAAVAFAAATPAAAEDPGDSFAALAYLRLPFTAKPYVGVSVQRDRIEASRPATRDYDTLWAQPKVIDVHLNPQTMSPVRVNGFEVASRRGQTPRNDVAWSAQIDR